ncbi:hypothetical protein ACS0TY_001746 [Phlomoides rotata]
MVPGISSLKAGTQSLLLLTTNKNPRKEMGEVTKPMKDVDEEEQAAKVKIWDSVFANTRLAVVNSAIQLQIADVLETHGGVMTHAELSAAVGCSPPVLRRIMRYLMNRRFFKQQTDTDSSISYTQTPLSRMLLKNGSNSVAAMILLESSPVMLAPWHRLSSAASGDGSPPFVAEHGQDLWEYASADPAYNKLFNDAMACLASHSMEAFIGEYPEAFNGITSLVDVGGGDGTTLRTVLKACPWIRGINFDRPQVVCVAPRSDGIEHVAGDMFDVIPKADAVFLMRVLHDWSDEECIHILKKCKEAIPVDGGKVIIAEAVIRDGEEDKFKDYTLAMDMVILASTDKGKERTYEEWEYVVKQAGFTRFTVKYIQAIISVIEAYP